MEHKVDDSQIFGYINGTITQKEREEVEKWIMLSPQNRRYFIELDSTNDAMNVDKTLFNAINLHEGYYKVTKKLSKRSLNLRSVLVVWQKIAAVLIIPLAIAFATYLMFDKNDFLLSQLENNDQPWQEVVSPNGARVNIDLPDGTKVVLNANSKLRFPIVFTAGKRVVELNGEAYFDVVSDKTNPFNVKCAHETIVATGTAFNVEAYQFDTLSMVILKRGVVDVSYNNATNSIKLMPGDRITRNSVSGAIIKESVDAAQLTAWKDGKLIFRDEKLSDIMRKIGMVYNADIIFQDREIMNDIYHATFENESLHEILRLMKMSMPIDYVDIDRKLQLNGNYTRRKIIIKNK